MIVLDTNQLEAAQPPDGPILTLLGTIAKETGHELAVPEMALREHLAHVRNNVESAYAALQSARRKLLLFVPSWPGEIPNLDVQLALVRRHELMKQVLRPLPAPAHAAANALDRELERILPAKTSWESPGAGGRDVVIWLTALEASRQSEGMTYFVSKDKDAFGGSELHPFLANEVKVALGEKASQFRYCYGIEALLNELAEKHAHRLGRENVAAAEPVREAVLSTLTGPDVYFELGLAAGLTGQGLLSANPVVQDLVLSSVQQITAYKVGNTVWATTRARWGGRKEFAVANFNAPVGSRAQVGVDFEVMTTLLMQLDSEGRITSAEVSGRGRCSNVRGRMVGAARYRSARGSTIPQPAAAHAAGSRGNAAATPKRPRCRSARAPPTALPPSDAPTHHHPPGT